MKPKVVDTKLCTDCRACELACSFHHLSLYNPSKASIKIIRDEKSGKIEIKFYYVPKGNHIACDECEGEGEMMCAKYCVRGVIS
jgi:Fe-S-cluster-containing hydrogenase component 2